MIERAKLKKGQKVLIHAGAAGSARLPSSWQKHIGAAVATTTSTEAIDYLTTGHAKGKVVINVR